MRHPVVHLPWVVAFGIIAWFLTFGGKCEPNRVEDPTKSTGLRTTVVDTGQTSCFNATGATVTCPLSTAELYGQDAQYVRNAPWYTDNGDGTVSDNNTGLMWQQALGDKVYWSNGPAVCAALALGGYSDWAAPTNKQLYSLIDFSGNSPFDFTSAVGANPYLDTKYFDFEYADTTAGERTIDAQYVTTTEYVDTVMSGQSAFFGVNFADGRIKGYPTGPGKKFFLRCVRGNADYGANDFVDNGDETITDRATDLMWMKQDSGHLQAGDRGDGAFDWIDALAWCEQLTGPVYSDWRLPNAKELQSILDYARSPGTTGSAAINALFSASQITNEAGQTDYPYYWTSTTHLDGRVQGTDAVYVAFGRAMGSMNGQYMDVHGAGAQRGDPKTATRGDTNIINCGQGPQGDCRRVFNYARCVRDAE